MSIRCISQFVCIFLSLNQYAFSAQLHQALPSHSNDSGWQSLSYTTYSSADSEIAFFTPNIGQSPLNKGNIHGQLADFSLPNIQEYLIIFEGEFTTPAHLSTMLWFDAHKQVNIQVHIDGNIQPRSHEHWQPTFSLKSGKQKLRIAYHTANSPTWMDKNFVGMITNKDLSIKMLPVTVAGQTYLDNTTFKIDASEHIQLSRRKIVGLPLTSIAVGLTNQFSYAFDTKTCDIVGLWKGEFLNIGPNIVGQGKDGSVVLGKWLFNPPNVIQFDGHDVPCTFIKYSHLKEPIFHFKQGEIHYQLHGKAVGSQLEFRVETIHSPTSIKVGIPITTKVNVSSPQGQAGIGEILIPASKTHKFTVLVSDI